MPHHATNYLIASGVDKNTYRHPHRNNFKKPGAPATGWCMPGLTVELVSHENKNNKCLIEMTVT